MAAYSTRGSGSVSGSERAYSPPAWAVDAGLAGANGLVAGTLVTLMRWARGEPLTDAFRGGFAEGALAGVAAYGGKRVAAARFTGAGLIGRQLHGAAVSGSRSVAEGGALRSRCPPLPGTTRDASQLPSSLASETFWSFDPAFRSPTRPAFRPASHPASSPGRPPTFRRCTRSIAGDRGSATFDSGLVALRLALSLSCLFPAFLLSRPGSSRALRPE